ncbi:hypothetical protein GIY23_00855 [Allosaccharopolyspora coralli]|uniref:Uncharacterized protein n=1 Tax=Allosaccharopolyspora coralli TaxID=2665642 RepID=A0A5Q3Q573_9PSEU|nr:hypothetical protein [Allosaccharopolyspora coralli]QGK68304.1 hypothetical protein GIY23_00855 [Allosaccharopolyspora coralli]
MRLPLQRVGRPAAEYCDVDSADVRFESMVPVSAAMDRYFGNVLTFFHRDLAGTDPGSTNPLVYEQMMQTAARRVGHLPEHHHDPGPPAWPRTRDPGGAAPCGCLHRRPPRAATHPRPYRPRGRDRAAGAAPRLPTRYRQAYGVLPSHTLRT